MTLFASECPREQDKYLPAAYATCFICLVDGALAEKQRAFLNPGWVLVKDGFASMRSELVNSR